MLTIDLAANERVERVISAPRAEPVVLRVRGATAVRVFDDECELTERRVNEGEDEVRIPIETRRLARWTRTIELTVQIQREGVAHPRSDGASPSSWSEIATLLVRPWGARAVRNAAIVIGGLSALVWLTAIPSAASQTRMAWDLAGGILGLVLIVWALFAKRVTAPGPALWGSLAALLVDVVSWSNTSAVLNVGGTFERGGLTIRAGWSRDVLGDYHFHDWPYWYRYESTYYAGSSLASSGGRCVAALEARHLRWWWRALGRPTHVLHGPDQIVVVPQRFVERAGIRFNDGVACGDDRLCCVDRNSLGDHVRVDLRADELPAALNDALPPTLTVRRSDNDAVRSYRIGEFDGVFVLSTDVPWTRIRWTQTSVVEWSRPTRAGARAETLAMFDGASRTTPGSLMVDVDGAPSSASSQCEWLLSSLRIVRTPPNTVKSLHWGQNRVNFDRASGVAILCGAVAGHVDRATVHVRAHDMGDDVRWSSRWSRFELPLHTVAPRTIFVAKEGQWTDAFATCPESFGRSRTLVAARIDVALRRVHDVYSGGEPQPLWSSWSSTATDIAFFCGDRSQLSRLSLFARIGDPTDLQRVPVVLRESASGEMVLEPARNRARRLANATR